jgi:hypothetical protein
VSGEAREAPSLAGVCGNCLTTYTASGPNRVRPIDVGPEKGNQRDPYRAVLHLCRLCGDALTAGRWDVLHERYAAERKVERKTTRETPPGEV